MDIADAVRAHLNETYTDSEGNEFKGQAISFLQKSLREEGWRKFGGRWGFEGLLQRKGFVVITGRNRRGQKAQVVTI